MCDAAVHLCLQAGEPHLCSRTHGRGCCERLPRRRPCTRLLPQNTWPSVCASTQVHHQQNVRWRLMRELPWYARNQMSFKNTMRQLQILQLQETLCAGENAMRCQTSDKHFKLSSNCSARGIASSDDASCAQAAPHVTTMGALRLRQQLGQLPFQTSCGSPCIAGWPPASPAFLTATVHLCVGSNEGKSQTQFEGEAPTSKARTPAFARLLSDAMQQPDPDEIANVLYYSYSSPLDELFWI